MTLLGTPYEWWIASLLARGRLGLSRYQGDRCLSIDTQPSATSSRDRIGWSMRFPAKTCECLLWFMAHDCCRPGLIRQKMSSQVIRKLCHGIRRADRTRCVPHYADPAGL